MRPECLNCTQNDGHTQPFHTGVPLGFEHLLFKAILQSLAPLSRSLFFEFLMHILNILLQKCSILNKISQKVFINRSYCPVIGQFHMSGVRMQIFEKKLHMKLYPVLNCRQVKVHIKINFRTLVTTMYSGGSPK